MSVIRTQHGRSERHFTVGSSKILLIVNQQHVERVIAEKAVARERARRREFVENLAA